MTMKTIDTISVGDIEEHPVWQYHSGSDFAIKPVVKLPCTSLNGRIVGAQLTLADGTNVWALLGNIDTVNFEFLKHFMTLSVEHNGEWFHLARYHDYDFDKRGPVQISEFLGKSIDKIFPIFYNIQSIFKEKSPALSGKIEKEPIERLTRAEIIALAVS